MIHGQEEVVIDVFGEPVVRNLHHVAPCRTIPVTEAMRREDARRSAEREKALAMPALAWRRSLEVRADEVARAVRRPAGRREVKSNPSKTVRYRTGAAARRCACGVAVRTGASSCYACRKAAGKRKPPCAKCGQSILGIKPLGDAGLICAHCRGSVKRPRRVVGVNCTVEAEAAS